MFDGWLSQYQIFDMGFVGQLFSNFSVTTKSHLSAFFYSKYIELDLKFQPGHKIGEGAKRSAKVHKCPENLILYRLRTLGSCFGPKRDFFVIFGSKLKNSFEKVADLKESLSG